MKGAKGYAIGSLLSPRASSARSRNPRIGETHGPPDSCIILFEDHRGPFMSDGDAGRGAGAGGIEELDVCDDGVRLGTNVAPMETPTGRIDSRIAGLARVLLNIDLQGAVMSRSSDSADPVGTTRAPLQRDFGY